MGLLRALRDAMRERRTPRLGPAEVERLLAGDPTGPEHRGLATLLDAAKAPATGGELAGEDAAVARLVAAYREAAPTSPPRGRRRARIASSAGTAAVKVAAGVVVLAVGGSALAAETGRLPAGAQQTAHELFSAVGIPAPTTTAAPTGAPATRPAPSATPTPSRTPTATPATTPAPGTVDPALRKLCRAWTVHHKPHGKAMTATAKRTLIRAAGGEAAVPAFCAHLLGGPAATHGTGKPGSTGEPATPGNGNNGNGNGNNGNGNGNGNNGGNGNGNGNNGNGNGHTKGPKS